MSNSRNCIRLVRPASFQFVRAVANGAISRSGNSCPVQRRCQESPTCEFEFSAARALSAKIAACVRYRVPVRSGKTGHSYRPLRGSVIEFIGCGTISTLSTSRRTSAASVPSTELFDPQLPGVAADHARIPPAIVSSAPGVNAASSEAGNTAMDEAPHLTPRRPTWRMLRFQRCHAALDELYMQLRLRASANGDGQLRYFRNNLIRQNGSYHPATSCDQWW